MCVLFFLGGGIQRNPPITNLTKLDSTLPSVFYSILSIYLFIFVIIIYFFFLGGGLVWVSVPTLKSAGFFINTY